MRECGRGTQDLGDPRLSEGTENHSACLQVKSRGSRQNSGSKLMIAIEVPCIIWHLASQKGLA